MNPRGTFQYLQLECMEYDWVSNCKDNVIIITRTVRRRLRRNASNESCSTNNASAVNVLREEITDVVGVSLQRLFLAMFLDHNFCVLIVHDGIGKQ